MSRVLSAAVALVLFAASSAAQTASTPGPRSDDPMASALARLDRSEYAEAILDFDKALDSYAAGQRLEEVRQTYMRMFVGNRHHSNVLMKAMKAWVGKHRATSQAAASASAFAEFDAWVQERDALAAATVNLSHNSPDWK